MAVSLDNNQQKRPQANTLLGLCFLAACLLMEACYRPWVYRNAILDYGVADSFPSFLGAIVVVLLFSSRADARRSEFSIASVAIAGCLLYELLQPLLPIATFDPWDLVAVLLGGVVALMLLFLVRLYYR